ncbi:MAG: hypothetical protein BWZ02_00055 [Lentisphaerae bacterium ADurb.BinA184]|nr:MAG: hypothetical protein BWZ02_00055 [Lentisphaerae bacterium ADurb.BinA184]
MRTARVRDDSRNTVYRVSNGVVGSAGQVILGPRERRKLEAILRRLGKLYVIAILSVRVWPTGYQVVCSAPAEAPDRATVEARFQSRYGKHAPLPDLDDPEVLSHWADRLRNVSFLFKDLAQCFTQWYNQTAMGGKRVGTVWRDRFKSTIVKAARQLLAAIAGTRSPDSRMAAAAFAESGWAVFCERHPGLANALAELRDTLVEAPGILADWLLPTFHHRVPGMPLWRS